MSKCIIIEQAQGHSRRATAAESKHKAHSRRATAAEREREREESASEIRDRQKSCKNFIGEGAALFFSKKTQVKRVQPPVPAVPRVLFFFLFLAVPPRFRRVVNSAGQTGLHR
jgi:hypothetical protein